MWCELTKVGARSQSHENDRSSETQRQMVRAKESLNGRLKKSGPKKFDPLTLSDL